MREIELLAPAANADIAIEAIRHGADAVYIGPPGFGARKNAANSIEDIRRVADFAHIYGVRVYATVNTIIYNTELKDVENLVWQLYQAGADALIVQDMALLRLNLPPIALHASTQCDTRTHQKAQFLEEAGFSQIVLARELTLDEIREITSSVSVPVETFIHGALCVSYSGRCHASQCTMNRSANRGECAQICRLPFTLSDASGKILARNRHLLSLKDFNASDRLEQLLDAGVSSFKIEGRLKDMTYVKNTVAWYRKRIDSIIADNPEKYCRASAGKSEIYFQPALEKSFNRGYTHYFLDSRRPLNISSPATPKSMGETIADINTLQNGDGISFFNSKGEYEGVMVNGIINGHIKGNRPFVIPEGAEIHRTFDAAMQKILSRPSATRRLRLDVTFSPKCLEGIDERGVRAAIRHNCDIQTAKTPRNLREAFDKFGNTSFSLGEFKIIDMPENIFIPASQLADARRRLCKAIMHTSTATYKYDLRRSENTGAIYPAKILDYQDNVANRLAEDFYRSHGVEKIEAALETQHKPSQSKSSCTLRSVMTTRHCILREAGKCLRMTHNKKLGFKLPLTLKSGNLTFQLDFDCNRCEMHLLHK